MQYRSTNPLGFVLGICASILHTNLGSWLITITHNSNYDRLIATRTMCKMPVLIMHILMIPYFADSLREGYSHLRALVMAYGDISPQSPLSMMSSSQQTTHQTSTTLSSSERTTPQINEENHSLIDAFPDVVSQPGQAHSAPRSWSRPQSQQSRSTPTSRPISGMERPRNRTPVSCSIYVCT